MKMLPKERGIALVVVLSLLALVSAWAASNFREDWISLRRAENIQLSARAWMAVESGFEFAHVLLKEDAAKGDNDHLLEDWARPTPAFEVDQGSIQTEIVDANRFINLNDLVDTNGVVQPEMLASVKRLFMILDLPPSLAYVLADWMDADHLSLGVAGSEDSLYFERSYKVKNAPLDSMQELLLVDGFDGDTLARLQTVATVRRSHGITPVNINTAPREVLMSLAPNVSSSDADAVITEREARPYEKVSDLTTHPRHAVWTAEIDPQRLSVASDAFIVRSMARFGRVRWAEEMLLLRNGATLLTEYRQPLGWIQ